MFRVRIAANRKSFLQLWKLLSFIFFGFQPIREVFVCRSFQ